jgi:hypothetical protein
MRSGHADVSRRRHALADFAGDTARRLQAIVSPTRLPQSSPPLTPPLSDAYIPWWYTHAMAMTSSDRGKIQTSIRLTPEAVQLRDLLSKKLGIDGTAVLEVAIRELARREGITVKPPRK